jgi:hypothetical protein
LELDFVQTAIAEPFTTPLHHWDFFVSQDFQGFLMSNLFNAGPFKTQASPLRVELRFGQGRKSALLQFPIQAPRYFPNLPG